MKPWKLIAGLLLAVATAALSAAAAAQPSEDPPSRVGRVSEYFGSLQLSTYDRPADWTEIGRNYPVSTGDNLWVAPDGRAEIEFGGGELRIAGEASLQVTRLDDDEVSVHVWSGRVIVRLRELDSGEQVLITSTNATIRLNRPGLYRVEVDPGDSRFPPATTMVVREGEVDFSTRRGSDYVAAGRGAVVTGDGDIAWLDRVGGLDGFDSWSASRDHRIDRSLAREYVSPNMIGWYELDEYGSWDRHPTYGVVWYPTTVAAGWAPYRYGRWVSVAPWGWTWIDDSPWGFAPFHYGRWVWISGRWGWCPGSYVRRPVYAPALVAWLGGPGWSVGINAGGPVYGWVPLGWGEPYWPHYRASNIHWRALNRPYAVIRAERRDWHPTRYVNVGIPGAVSAVPARVFTGGSAVARNALSLPPSVVARAPGGSAPTGLAPRFESGRGNLVATPRTAAPRLDGGSGGVLGGGVVPPSAAPVARDRFEAVPRPAVPRAGVAPSPPTDAGPAPRFQAPERGDRPLPAPRQLSPAPAPRAGAPVGPGSAVPVPPPAAAAPAPVPRAETRTLPPPVRESAPVGRQAPQVFTPAPREAMPVAPRSAVVPPPVREAAPMREAPPARAVPSPRESGSPPPARVAPSPRESLAPGAVREAPPTREVPVQREAPRSMREAPAAVREAPPAREIPVQREAPRSMREAPAAVREAPPESRGGGAPAAVMRGGGPAPAEAPRARGEASGGRG